MMRACLHIISRYDANVFKCNLPILCQRVDIYSFKNDATTSAHDATALTLIQKLESLKIRTTLRATMRRVPTSRFNQG